MNEPVNDAYKLKPCPFCGSKFAIINSSWVNDSGEETGAFEFTHYCESHGGYSPARISLIATSREGVIKAWNRRAK